MEATLDERRRDRGTRRRPGPGMVVLRIAGLVLAVLIGAGIWLWSLEAPETGRPWLYEKGTYLGTADSPLEPAARGELEPRARLQGQ